jgi:methyl-accepting chemotaxis protein
MLEKISFNAKLTAATAAVVLVTIAILTSINVWQAQKSLTSLAMASLESSGSTLHRTMATMHDVVQGKLESDLAVLKDKVERLGGVSRNPEDPKTMTVTHQITGQKQTITFDRLYAGDMPVDTNLLVDSVQAAVGGTATIFHVLGDKLVRVSTNVRKLDGSRAVGTYIPASSPVYKTVMAGDTFTGRAYVVNAWYVTAYTPMRDEDGEIVAVVYVGRKILSDYTRDLVLKETLGGNGYVFVFDSEGEIIIHPDETLVGTNITQFPFGQDMIDTRNAFLDYEFRGDHKTAYMAFFEPWDWHMGVSMREDSILQDADNRIYASSAIAAAALVVGSIFLVSLAIKALTAPLRRMNDYTTAVASGDYDARIDYHADDVIGQTVDSVQAMVGDLKSKLGFSQGVLQGIAFPCMVVDQDGRVSYINDHLLTLTGKTGTPSDFLGQDAGGFFYNDPDRKTKAEEAMAQKKRVSGEIAYQRADGRDLVMQADASPIYDLDGLPLGAIAIYVDLTTIREQEARIRSQNETIAHAAAQATQIADLVSSASEELAAQIQQASQGAALQNERTSETVTATEEMNASVLEVAKNASGAAGNADQARDKANQGETVVREVIAAIAEVQENADYLQKTMSDLGEQAGEIDKIITVIEDIADQTNLLALNAAIEAARAGEAGRGFAVVADEVRKLAEKTMAATKEVARTVTNIQDGTRHSVEATDRAGQAVARSTELAEKSGEALREIVSIVEGTAEQVTSIATASEQQSAASEEITHSIEEIARISNETAEGMHQSTQAVDELATQALKLKDIIDKMQQ